MAEARTYYEEPASKNPGNDQPKGQVAELRRQVSELAQQIGDYASKAAREFVDRVDEVVHENSLHHARLGRACRDRHRIYSPPIKRVLMTELAFLFGNFLSLLTRF